jgi:hypothetical protein
MGDGIAARSASNEIAAKTRPPSVQGEDMRLIFQATNPKRMPTKRKAYPEMLCPTLSITPPCHLSGSRSVILEPERIEIIPRAALMTAQTVVIRTARSTARRADGSSLIVGHSCTGVIYHTRKHGFNCSSAAPTFQIWSAIPAAITGVVRSDSQKNRRFRFSHRFSLVTYTQDCALIPRRTDLARHPPIRVRSSGV